MTVDKTRLDVTGLGGRGMSGDKAGDCSGKQLWREAVVGGSNLKRIRSPSPDRLLEPVARPRAAAACIEPNLFQMR